MKTNQEIALEVANALRQDDLVASLELCTRFLARVKEEEGKDAVGYDAIFNAIGKSVTGNGDLGISVKAFKAVIGGEIFTTPQPCLGCQDWAKRWNKVMDEVDESRKPCPSCDEKQSAIDVWEGRYADLAIKCAELEYFCISQGNELAKLDEKVFDQDRLLKQQAEKISATLVALAGLPDGALDGGWTYAGMNKYALGLEAKCAELEAERDALELRIRLAEGNVARNREAYGIIAAIG